MNKKLAQVLVMILLALPCLVSVAYSTTIDASDCTVQSITTAISLAPSGGTVKVPSGTCTWSTTLVLNKSIQLIGSGAGASGTKITSTGANGYISVATGTNNWRISGFSFSTSTSAWLAIRISQYSGDSNIGWRIDHNKFQGYHYAIYGLGIYSSDNVSSVVDNNEFFGGGVQFFGESNYSSGPWTRPTKLGGADFVFVESNRFSDVGALTSCSHAVATNDSARIVVRYNDFLIEDTGTNYGQWDIFDAHGYGHGQNVRGVRVYEVYNNTFTRSKSVYLQNAVALRGGTGVVYSNRFDGTYTRGAIKLHEVRASTAGDTTLHSVVSQYCNGSPLCQASYYRLQTTDDPYAKFGLSGAVVVGATSGATGVVFKVTNVNGFYVYFLSITNGPFKAGENLLVGGTVKTSAAADLEAKGGEGYPCCDQVGRGQNQASEPAFFWNNIDDKGNPVTVGFNEPGVAAVFVEGRDYCTHDTSTSCNGVSISYTPYKYPHPLARLSPPKGLTAE